MRRSSAVTVCQSCVDSQTHGARVLVEALIPSTMRQDPPPQSFLLLTIPDCRLISSTGIPSDTQGSLGIVCVTLDIDSFSGWSQTSDQASRDVWLVLRIGSIDIPISPTETIWHSQMSRSYTFTATTLERSPRISVFLPVPTTTSAQEDAETLNVVLSQYGIVQQIDPDPYAMDGDLRVSAASLWYFC